jgi:hypothetical protein
VRGYLRAAEDISRMCASPDDDGQERLRGEGKLEDACETEEARIG